MAGGRLKGLRGLSYQDSNLDRQNQKLQCYHYTIRQSLSFEISNARARIPESGAKLAIISETAK